MGYPFLENFISFTRSHRPAMASSLVEGGMSEVMVSPKVVDLPAVHLATIRSAVSAIEKLRALPQFQKISLQSRPEGHISRFDPGYGTIFDCFDFHLNDSGPKLIEINTNGSGSLLSALLLEYHGLLGGDHWGDCWTNFGNMVQAVWTSYLRSCSSPDRPLRRLAIVDSAPRSQRTYFEFRMFQEFFRSHGIEAVIADPSELSTTPAAVSFQGETVDLIYNRLTDFYIDAPEHAALRTAYLNRAVCMTPHPFGYGLVADKSQLIKVSNRSILEKCGLLESQINAIQKVALKTVILNSENATSLWDQRKQYFFKPQQAYGGKSTYKGASISRTPFERMIAEASIAQELAEPGKVGEFKFDLRVYTHEGQILLIGARFFQGQLLNFKTVGGGFGAVRVLP